MWRVEADVHFSSWRSYNRERSDPFELFSDQDFIEKHRVTKQDFTELLDQLGPALQRPTRRSLSLEPSTLLSCALCYYAEGTILRVIGDLHGISANSAGHAVHEVSNVLCSNMANFVSWPGEEEMSASKTFFRKLGFPDVMGVLDGTHVPIYVPRPPVVESDFVNQKAFHSINAQLLCDSEHRIRDISASWPGSTPDSVVLENSAVCEHFEAGSAQDSLVLGDSAYPLSKWLMVPFRTPSSPAEERYNDAHEKARAVMERCVAMLKMRWRCLTNPIMFQPTKVSSITRACAALHNFAIRKNIPFDEDTDKQLLASCDMQEVCDKIPICSKGMIARTALIAKAFA